MTAIVRREALGPVERSLQELGVPGLSVSTVKGYGEYADFSCRDWFVTHVRIEVFTDAERARTVAPAVDRRSARTGRAWNDRGRPWRTYDTDQPTGR